VVRRRMRVGAARRMVVLESQIWGPARVAGLDGWRCGGGQVVSPEASLRPAAARKGLRPRIMRPKLKHRATSLGYLDAPLRDGLRDGLVRRNWAGARTGARYASEKQVPRCARNDSQKDKSKGKGKDKGRNKGKARAKAKQEQRQRQEQQQRQTQERRRIGVPGSCAGGERGEAGLAWNAEAAFSGVIGRGVWVRIVSTQRRGGLVRLKDIGECQERRRQMSAVVPRRW
jgi:hypothetical protein